MNSKLILSVMLISMVSGCATSLSPKASFVQSADSRMVEDCIFLGDVHGSSGWGGLAASQGMINSRNETLEQAARIGATHVVWGNITGGFSPSAYGKAYNCSKT